ncbi:hypothetical protein KCMC57_up18390 [Kitasatospora sp. CMC57]|uniref:Uncharacterized protein n=1 Tax=Kitasatospora sp. CMC57 TaxID=3231513 RepID=A0AB33JRM4_9ACTN
MVSSAAPVGSGAAQATAGATPSTASATAETEVAVLRIIRSLSQGVPEPSAIIPPRIAGAPADTLRFPGTDDDGAPTG